MSQTVLKSTRRQRRRTANALRAANTGLRPGLSYYGTYPMPPTFYNMMRWSDFTTYTIAGTSAQHEYKINSLHAPGSSTYNATGYAEMYAFYAYSTVTRCNVMIEITNTHTDILSCVWLFSPVQHAYSGNEIAEASNQPHSTPFTVGLPNSGTSTRRIRRSIRLDELFGTNLDLTANFRAGFINPPAQIGYGNLLVYSPTANPTYHVRITLVFEVKWDRQVFNIG